MIEMDMQRRDLQIMMLVLGLGQPSTQIACLVVVNIGERSDAETIALPHGVRLQLRARLRLAQDVAQSLRTAGIAMRLHVPIEGLQEIIVDR